MCSYTEAHKIKLKCDALEAWELEKWKNAKQQEMFQREAKFKHQKQQELIALQKRIQVLSLDLPNLSHISPTVTYLPLPSPPPPNNRLGERSKKSSVLLTLRDCFSDTEMLKMNWR